MATNKSDESAQELTAIPRVGSETADSLQSAGFESVADVRDAEQDELTEADGVGESRASEIKENADSIAADDESSDASDDDADQQETESVSAPSGEPGDGEGAELSGDDLGIIQMQSTVRDVAETLIEDPFDGIIEIERAEDRWYAVVEVIERSAVPDTQDILGRYEIDLDDSGSVLGYRLTDRYRRGEVSNGD